MKIPLTPPAAPPAAESAGAEAAGTTRREFLATGAIAAAWVIVPRHVLGRGQTPPSDRLNIAVVGIGGMGAGNAEAVMSENIVAICDVDDALVDARLENWRRAARPQASPVPPATPPRPPAAGAPPPPRLDFRSFGPSALQQAADDRWRAPILPRNANLERFVNDQLPRLKRHRDYREMLSQQKDIDALIIA